MKFFIYLYCLAHLLTKLSARLRLTTPMTSALRSYDDEARERLNIVNMIDFINSVYNDGGPNIPLSHRYEPMIRRFNMPAVEGRSVPPSVSVANDQDMETQLEKLDETVRYHVINNPEVLEEYSKKQKLKNVARLLKSVTFNPVVSMTSAEGKAFNTAGKNLNYYHPKSETNASHNVPNSGPLDVLRELSTIKHTYEPTFPDNDEEILISDDREMSGTDIKTNTPRVEAEHHDGNTEVQHNIINITKTEKETQNNKAVDENKDRIEEQKAQNGNTKEVSELKQGLPLKTEKSNISVAKVDEKIKIYKEYETRKVDNNSSDYENDRSKEINTTTDTKNEKHKKPKERSWDNNKVINVSEEKLVVSKDKSALRTNYNRDFKKEHSVYTHKENDEHSKRHRHEKKHEHVKKNRYKNNDGRSKKKKYWNDNDSGYDRMEHEWNKRHQQYDDNDNLDRKDNNWDNNDDFNSRDYDSNMRDDDESNKGDKNWQKRQQLEDSYWDKKDNSWKKRNSGWDREIDWNNRDDDWNKKDSEDRAKIWNTRESQRIKQEIKSYKNDWERKRKEMDNKYSRIHVEKYRGGHGHGRYEIVGRKRRPSEFNQNPEI